MHFFCVILLNCLTWNVQFRIMWINVLQRRDQLIKESGDGRWSSKQRSCHLKGNLLCRVAAVDSVWCCCCDVTTITQNSTQKKEILRTFSSHGFIYFLDPSVQYYVTTFDDSFPDVLSLLVLIPTCCHSDIMVLIPHMTAVENWVMFPGEVWW